MTKYGELANVCVHVHSTMIVLLLAVAMAATAPVARALGGGDWPMAGKDYANTRYSELADIGVDNVGRLQLAFTFSTGVVRGHEAAPIVAGDSMYIVTPYPNVVYALDLTKPGANVRWKFEPKPLAAAQGVACCNVVNRGAAYAGGRVYFNTLDNQTIALDAKTGSEQWRTKLGDINRGESMTMAPLAVKGKVLVGNSGAEFGVRGWLTALDARTGAIAWRAYSTGPDKEVLIGSSYQPFLCAGARQRPRRAVVAARGVEDRRRYRVGIRVVRPRSRSDLLRHRQSRPMEPGAATRRQQVDRRPVRAAPRQRRSALVLSDHAARPARLRQDQRKHPRRPGRQGHAAQGPDPSGPQRLSLRDRSHERRGAVGDAVRACQHLHRRRSRHRQAAPCAGQATGGRQGRARDLPRVAGRQGLAAGRLVAAHAPRLPPAPEPVPGRRDDADELHRRHAVRRRRREDVRRSRRPSRRVHRLGSGRREEGLVDQESFPGWSGALVTAGDVVFYGTMDGWFKALDAKSGALLWRYKTESGIVGQPVSYRGPDGKQYVAVLSGVGGWAGAIVAADLDARDPTAALGFANAMKDLPKHTTKGGMLHVFALP